MSFNLSHNPFATRFLRPGAVPFLFSEADNLDAIVGSFERSGSYGQIVGPHGCGKSTLCYSIADKLQVEFGLIKFITIRSAKVVSVRSHNQVQSRQKRVLTIVDGLERLSWLQQKMLIANLLKKDSVANWKNGLLITSHRRIKFVPVLARLEPSAAAFKQVVHFLDPDCSIGEHELNRIYEEVGGNIREALMACYDWHAGVPACA